LQDFLDNVKLKPVKLSDSHDLLKLPAIGRNQTRSKLSYNENTTESTSNVQVNARIANREASNRAI
jgi:hypothetical protein